MPKGKLKVQIDKIELLIKYRNPYLTVEVFLSIFIAIGAQTKRANRKFPKADKIRKWIGKKELNNKEIIKKLEEPIKIKKTINGILAEPVKNLLNFSQRFGVKFDWII